MPAANIGDLADRDLLVAAARAAGELALTFFGKSPKTWSKAGDSPVTEADLAVDHLLKERLLAARPGYGWLSEETADTPARRDARRLFVVDPIDGTRAFIAGNPEWMVALGVVEAGRPVAAALMTPVTGEVYAAALNAGATLNGRPIQVTDVADPAAAKVAGARAPLEVALPAFREMVPRVPSLALRLARVAEGALDAAFAKHSAHDWDLAGVDLVVHEAGGLVTDLKGAPLAYNGASLQQPSLMAAGPRLHAALVAALSVASARRSARD